MVKFLELRDLENRTKHDLQTAASELRTNKTQKMYIQQFVDVTEEQVDCCTHVIKSNIYIYIYFRFSKNSSFNHFQFFF
jgi:hypothetical protein